MAPSVMYFTDSPSFGGAEQVLLTLMEGFSRHQWRVILAHHAEPGLAPFVKATGELGIQVRALPRYVHKTPRSHAQQARALLYLLRSQRPDVFHANMAWPMAARYALLVAALARVPAVIATIHSFDVAISPRSALMHRLVGLGVDRYIAVSSFVADRLSTTLRVPPRKLRIVANGIQLRDFGAHDSTGRTVRSCARIPPVVLTPARLDPIKGHATLLAAAVKVPDTTFVFAGEGSAREALTAYACRLGVADRVRFLGHRSDIPDLLATSDLVVLPSLCEGFGLAVAEAMAAGKAVIATAAGAVPEIVRHGETGLLVQPADPDALASAIRGLLADPAKARRLGCAGREYARHAFRADRMVDRVASVYTEILGGAVS